MKTRFPLLALFGCLLAVGGAVIFAQDNSSSRPPASKGGTVAVIDINRIFKEHKRFRARKEELSKDVKAYEDKVNRQTADIVKQREGLKQYKSGSPEYKRIEESMTHQLADMQVQKGRKRNEIIQREAEIFYETYMEITAEVARIADRHGISLVLRYNSEKMDLQNPASVKAGIVNTIVYQSRRDITDMVLLAVNPPLNARRP